MFASLPVAATPRGGVDSGFTGVTTGPEETQGAAPQGQGLGPLLEAPPQEVFNTVDELVRRQELIAQNHLAQDTHWSLFVGGYPFSWLKHDTGRDVWSTGLPYGVSAVSIQAVPNKVLDLVNKKSEAVTVDFPEPDPEPLDDSEEAEGACDIAQRFLAQDGSEQGTNDAVLFDERLKRALWSSSTYLECWVDPVGGGYVPLQIEAHPEAVDANKPLVGPNGDATTDYVMRYVTQDGQFTTKASEAAPQWQPKLMASKWGREHIRCYPEDRPVSEAERVIILGYCTVREAKRRWPDTIGQMTDAEITTLCDWTPTRYLVLLPPYQRARWKQNDGKQNAKGKGLGGAFDEQILFYYHLFGKATPEYPKGADITVSGAKGGTILGSGTLDADVELTKNGSSVSETRCLEIPVVQIRPRQDLIGGDPTGRAWVELIAGAAENNAFLANRFARVIDKILTHPFVSTADSPISAANVAAARSSGEFLSVVTKDSIPAQLPVPALPAAFFNMYQLADESLNSIASAERAASGADNSKERSGKAIQLAVSQNNVGNTSMLQSFNDSVARWNRIKLEQAMRSFSTPQLLRYEGEDGTAQADEFKAMDFALVGKVTIKSGTGTGLPPDQKVNYLASLRANGFMDEGDAQDAARPAFAKTLGAPPNPHEQYVARCVQSWLDGPPEVEQPDPNAPPTIDPTTGQPAPPQDWKSQYRTWLTAQQQYEAAQAKFTSDQQAFQQYTTLAATAAAGPPSGTLGPEAQTEKAGFDYQTASIHLQALQMQNPAIGQPPVAPQAPQTPKPWTPFEPRPNDSVPAIATIWERRLSRLMSSNKYTAFGDEWKDVLDRAYATARQNVAIASGAQGGAPQSASPAPQSAQKPKPAQPQAPQRQPATGAPA